LSGYQDAFTTAVGCSDTDWYNLVVLDLHDLEAEDEAYVMEVVAHEIAHVLLGHRRLRDISALTPALKDRHEVDAREQVIAWGFGVRDPSTNPLKSSIVLPRQTLESLRAQASRLKVGVNDLLNVLLAKLKSGEIVL
jgi:hypothetical protein